MKIAAIVPCLNEATVVAETIRNIYSAYPEMLIYVVDNGSTDETANVALKAGAIVVHEHRRGKGFAFETGYRNLPKDVSAILMIDGDNTYGLETLMQGLLLIEKGNVDMVIGNRVSVNNFSMSTVHRLGNVFFTRLQGFLFSSAIQDPLSGWRLFSNRFLLGFPFESSSFDLEVSLNAYSWFARMPVQNIDVQYYPRDPSSQSKLRTFSDGFYIARRKFKLFRDLRSMLAFSILAFPFILITIFFIYRASLNFLETGLVALPSLLLGMFSFQISAFLVLSGIILDRINHLRYYLIKTNSSKSVIH